MQHSVAVFCSSSSIVSQDYVVAAVELGKYIGMAGYELVWGGSIKGLMGTVADATKQFHGKLYGVIPEKIEEVKYEDADELIITKDLRERKKIMTDRATAFVAVAGGFGTLDEVIEVLVLKQLGYHNKAIVFLNTNNFFEHLLLQIERMITEFTVKAEYRDLFFVANTPQEAFDHITHYSPPTMKKKWF